VTALVLAELRARRRGVGWIGIGCLAAVLAIASSYGAMGGQQGMTRCFGGGDFTKILAVFSGSPSADIYSPAGYLGFSFAHPIVLVLVISVAISSGVAAIAADVESGRAEMLYTAPVSRGTIFGARLISWLIAQTAVMACAAAGTLLGSQLFSALAGVSPLVPLRLAVQFDSLAFFLGAAAFAASARARTRGAALGVAIGVAAGSYVANLVALLWNPARFLRHLTPFGYYNASAAADHLNWPDLGLLVSTGTLLLLLARRWLENRDLT